MQIKGGGTAAVTFSKSRLEACKCRVVRNFGTSFCVRTEMHFRNLISSNRNQIVFTIFRLIWNQTDVRLDPNQSEND